MQGAEIRMGRMHLFGLAATAIDNPNHLAARDIADRLVDTLLPSDTILFFVASPPRPALGCEECWCC